MNEPEKLPLPRDEAILRAVLFAFVIVLPTLGLLASCAAPEPIMIERTTVEICPPEAPTDTCPDFPVLGADVTIEQLEDAWIDGKKVYAECAAVLSEWRSAWDSCPRE